MSQSVSARPPATEVTRQKMVSTLVSMFYGGSAAAEDARFFEAPSNVRARLAEGPHVEYVNFTGVGPCWVLTNAGRTAARAGTAVKFSWQ